MWNDEDDRFGGQFERLKADFSEKRRKIEHIALCWSLIIQPFILVAVICIGCAYYFTSQFNPSLGLLGVALIALGVNYYVTACQGMSVTEDMMLHPFVLEDNENTFQSLMRGQQIYLLVKCLSAVPMLMGLLLGVFQVLIFCYGRAYVLKTCAWPGGLLCCFILVCYSIPIRRWHAIVKRQREAEKLNDRGQGEAAQ